MTDAPQPPGHVTRFYGNTDFALDVIANRQITFVHASTLNDPFDPYFFFETDFGKSRAQVLRYIKAQHPEDEAWFKRHVTTDRWQQTIDDLETKLESWKTGSFIFSTSGESEELHPKDNLYMWGHYANGHRGVAIEFDAQELAASVLAHQAAVNSEKMFAAYDVWAKIEYRKTFPPLSAEDYYEFIKQEWLFTTRKISTRIPTTLECYYNLMGRVKSEVWESENEWRLLWLNNETRMKFYRCPITHASIHAVVLGLSTADSSRKDFAAETTRNFPNATLMQAKKRYGDLALSFERLSAV